MRMSVKLWLGMSIMVLGFMATLVIAVVFGMRLEESLAQTGEALFPATVESGKAVSAFDTQTKAYEDAFMMAEMSMLEEASAQAEEVKAALGSIAGLETSGLSPQRAEAAKTLLARYATWVDSATAVYGAVIGGGEDDAELDEDAQDALMEQVGKVAEEKDALSAALTTMVDGLSADLKNSLAQIADASKTQRLVMLCVFLGAITLSLVAVSLMIASVTKSIKAVIEGMTRTGGTLVHASGQVSSSSDHMARSAGEQAANIEEVSASLEEMTSMTRQNADNASQANAKSSDAAEAASKGQDAMVRMSEAIQKIKTSSDETAKIVKTIDEIAFQTNLLALNAAVEAARAGDAGKGFAVVAEEVRNLAQRSAEAAKTTSELIEGSQGNADNGVKVCADVGKILKQIGESVEQVTQLVAEVTVASQEQAKGVDQINSSIAHMDQFTQTNAATAEESAAASKDLSALAGELTEMVSALRAVVKGRHAAGESGVESDVFVETPDATPPQRPERPERRQLPAHQEESIVVAPEQVIPLTDEEVDDF